MKVLAIDPGGACTGWAWFVDGRLISCGLSRTKEKTPFARAMAHLANLQDYIDSADRVICEAMWFRQGKNKGNPQDLIDLNLIAGKLGREWVHPHVWKGMKAKEVHQPLILAELSDSERKQVPTKPKSLVHNAVDAVGIGLYALNRMRPEGHVDVTKLVRRRKSEAKPRSSRKTRAGAVGRRRRADDKARPGDGGSGRGAFPGIAARFRAARAA